MRLQAAIGDAVTSKDALLKAEQSGTLPENGAEHASQILSTLLMEAERILWPATWKVQECNGQVVELAECGFAPGGPIIRYDTNMKSVHTELSMNAASYWPTFYFELAHEVVHLLDPSIGGTNLLEEGIAVEFQLDRCKVAGISMAPTQQTYVRARELVRQLKSPFRVAKTLREKFGPLKHVTERQLLLVAPYLDPRSAQDLTSVMMMR